MYNLIYLLISAADMKNVSALTNTVKRSAEALSSPPSLATICPGISGSAILDVQVDP